MTEQSELFSRAHGLLEAKSYEEAISLFKKVLVQEPNNFAAYNNIGVAQAFLGIKGGDKSLLQSAKQHFQRAIALASESVPSNRYETAENNLKWAEKELKNIS